MTPDQQHLKDALGDWRPRLNRLREDLGARQEQIERVDAGVIDEKFVLAKFQTAQKDIFEFNLWMIHVLGAVQAMRPAYDSNHGGNSGSYISYACEHLVNIRDNMWSIMVDQTNWVNERAQILYKGAKCGYPYMFSNTLALHDKRAFRNIRLYMTESIVDIGVLMSFLEKNVGPLLHLSEPVRATHE